MNMTTEFQICEAKSLARFDARDELIDEVWRGLAERPRSLVPWMLYDAEGSRLFECITTLGEYYPTRTEREILANYAPAIIAATGSDSRRPLRLLELNVQFGCCARDERGRIRKTNGKKNRISPADLPLHVMCAIGIYVILTRRKL